VNPLIDSVVALKNAFGEFSKSDPAATVASAPAQAAAQA
jgi:hypothetical protein